MAVKETSCGIHNNIALSGCIETGNKFGDPIIFLNLAFGIQFIKI